MEKKTNGTPPKKTQQKQKKKNTPKNTLHSLQIGDHSRVPTDCDILPCYWSQRTAIHSVEFPAFNWPLVMQQWSFLPILLPWNARFSPLLVLSCVWPATQLTHSPLHPANRKPQSVAHAQIFRWKGSICVISAMYIMFSHWLWQKMSIVCCTHRAP